MLGEKIKQLRRNRGISLTKLASLAGVSKSYLSQLEKGTHSNPSITYIKKIADVLEVDTAVLIAEKNHEPDLEEWKKLLILAIESGITKDQFHSITQIVKKTAD
jgi:XRE family transcriptional regulator of biofilm formation